MTQTYVERRYADGTYGLGEEVIPGVYLFRAGNHGLTSEEELRAVRNGLKGLSLITSYKYRVNPNLTPEMVKKIEAMQRKKSEHNKPSV